MIMINARLYYSHGLSSTKGYAHYFIIKLISHALPRSLSRHRSLSRPHNSGNTQIVKDICYHPNPLLVHVELIIGPTRPIDEANNQLSTTKMATTGDQPSDTAYQKIASKMAGGATGGTAAMLQLQPTTPTTARTSRRPRAGKKSSSKRRPKLSIWLCTLG
mmetsp:Transcript_20196/g.57928  ORF Transcript_20196/g.57928 Transcript_20196/m.57928 type:complete len:161 (+) Transcript_20196:1885-2367(+)